MLAKTIAGYCKQYIQINFLRNPTWESTVFFCKYPAAKGILEGYDIFFVSSRHVETVVLCKENTARSPEKSGLFIFGDMFLVFDIEFAILKPNGNSHSDLPMKPSIS